MHTQTPVAAALASVTIGPEVTFENLTMLPLLRCTRSTTSTSTAGTHGASTPSTNYVVLDDALHSGVADITELDGHGSVPELKFANRGIYPVLIVDGEELVGAKQNRVVNLTILVAPQTNLTIPVSCVEAGRWRARSHGFRSAPRAQFATGRAKRVAQVTYSLKARGDRRSDQAEVWADIAEKSSRMNAPSPTSAMDAIFVDHATSIDAYVAACQPQDDQVGAVFAVNGTIIGLDLFDEPSTLRKLLPKLVRSVAVEAIDSKPAAQPFRAAPPPALAEQFLAVASAAPEHTAKAVGLGDDIRLTAPGIAGAALVADQHVVHLAAFAL